MKRGLLADYFEAVVVKRLSAVEIDTKKSNQHEINGYKALREIFGTEKRRYPAKFIWLQDEQEAISEDGFLTWYDARENHPTRTEYRFYFPTTSVTELASEGDTLFIAKRTDGSVLLIITPAASTIQSQLIWLFGLPEQPDLEFSAQEIAKEDSARLDFAARYILDELGVEYDEPQADLLDALLEKFGAKFPKMAEFSEFARSTIPEIKSTDDPDVVVLAWMEREELLFRRLERHLISDRLKMGFLADGAADVDGFIEFSMSVQNRRKSRAGGALESHLGVIFDAHKIRYGAKCTTEGNHKPDFLFPGCTEYSDKDFPEDKLMMLGAKSTLKERWRQVLTEAKRVKGKHLITLSPGISESQTNQMKDQNLQLVVPRKLHETYKNAQRAWLLDLSTFIEKVRKSQA